MQDVSGHNTFSPEGDSPIETADAVARAAHLWIRSLCLREHHRAGERQSLAGGLLCGLCRRLGLDTRLQHLVAYVYALLDDEGQQALPVSRLMLEKPQPRLQRDAFERGESEAESIAEMLAYYRHKM